MKTFQTNSKIVAVAAVALLALGAGVANAQGFTPPNTDIRALEAPVDVTANQLNAFGVAPRQGRSVAHDRGEAAVDQDR
ncbi:hypothetical protein [Beijerinckia sp. L45]|uniref:hypothetical protein n=1 Tax=Beijerinckia sp. L45 TaxID=1641855 RepID=UPI00131DAB14|nr:hypothetical protein [Beijerinckia sp. L45]